MPRRLEWLIVVAIVALGAWLRLSHLDLAEYKADEAIAIDLTLPLIEGSGWPEAGLVSSVGIRNPPMLMYLLAVPLIVDVDPLVASAFVGLLSTLAVLATYLVMRPRFGVFVAISSAALFATAPWAVLFGRKIWATDLLPIFAVALLHCLFTVLERRKTWMVLFVPVLACVLWQLHLSAFAVLPVAGVVLLYAARQLRWPAVALGTGLAVLLLVPYVHHQVSHEWRDLQTLRGLAGRSVEKQVYDLQPVWHTAQIAGADGWSYVAGYSDRAFRSSARAVRGATDVASTVSTVLLVGGFVLLLAGVARRAWRRRAPIPRLDLQDERCAVLLLWIGGIWAAFIAARLDALYPQYFVLTYPAPFVIVALTLDRCRHVLARWQRMPVMAGAAVLVIAMCAAYSAFDVSFVRFLERQGGTRGDYGIAYRHKSDVTTFALRHDLELRAAPQEIAQLMALRRRYPRPDQALASTEAVPPGRVLEIRELFREGDFADCAPERTRTFGPLVTCIRP